MARVSLNQTVFAFIRLALSAPKLPLRDNFLMHFYLNAQIELNSSFFRAAIVNILICLDAYRELANIAITGY